MRGSVRRRSAHTWTLEASAGFDPVTGKRRRFTQTVRGTKREAEAELAKLVMKIETGTTLDPARLTVSEYLTRWLEHAKTRVRPRTWSRYEQLVRVHVVGGIGHVPLAKLRPA